MDVHTKQQRSFNMSRIKSTGTKPELKLRKFLWAEGLRGYRIKNKIKGRPDIYYPGVKLAIFIDGCFWHMCPECFIAPGSNRNFWKRKLNQNVVRDRLTDETLEREGISFIRFWEHEIDNNMEECAKKIRAVKLQMIDSSVVK